MGQRFGVAMVGWVTAIEAGNVVNGTSPFPSPADEMSELIIYTEYPWDKLPSGASVCDVGAGIGNITLQLAKAHPHLQLKLQDLPERIVQAREEVWPKQCPEAIAENRIEFEAIDFFTQSPIPNCDVYYVR